MTQSLLQTLLPLVLVFLCHSSLSQAQKYEGKYLLIKVQNDQSKNLVRPARATSGREEPKQYTFNLEHTSLSDEGSHYFFKCRITNKITGNFTVDETDGTVLSVDSYTSTRIMPQADEYKLENGLSQAIRNMDVLIEKPGRLVLSGDEGSVVLKAT
jgi:hypothetical protein